jgi:hypothetical protein
MKAINFSSINQLHLRQYEYNHKTSASLPNSITKQPGRRHQFPNLRNLEKFIHTASAGSFKPVGFRRS